VTVLEIDGLTVSRGERKVLVDVSLLVGAGEVIGILGPNGAGKSTLLAAVLGLVPANGTINLLGRPARSYSAREKGRHVAYLPQQHNAAWPMSVEAIVALGRLPHRPGFGPPSPSDRAAVERAMSAIGVTDLRHRRISELSGGERARVLIARMLAQEAPLILADEPTSGLDPAHQIALLSLFRRQAADGRSVLLTLHELHLAARWCDRIFLLKEGAIAAEGAPKAALTAERIAEVYGCTAYVACEHEGLIVVPTGLATLRSSG